MPPTGLAQDVARQFGLPDAPTVLAQRQLPKPIAFTRLRATAMVDACQHSATPDPAFALLVALAPSAAVEICCPGDTFLFDLATSPPASFAGPFDFVRFYLPAATLNRLADDQGLERVQGLRTTPRQVRDPVMQGLAMSLLPVLEAPDAGASRFLDSVALAFHAHVMRSYGDTPASGRHAGSGLAPWQLRRVRSMVDSNLDADLSIADLASECRLSLSHFGRAFSASMGTSPHKWLVNQRIGRAKALLLDGSDELSQIALSCRFVDQSHFTRVFARSEGLSPGRWRRGRCRAS